MNCDPSGSDKAEASHWPGLRYYLLPKVMKLKFDHALVALDLSDSAEALVRSLSYFRQFDTERLTLLTSLSVKHAGFLNRKKRERIQKRLDRYRDFLKNEGYSVNTVLKYGIWKSTSSVIITTAKERGVNWIVMGNRGQNKFNEYFIGSTATEVLHQTSLPVMLLNVNPVKREEKRVSLEEDVQYALYHIIHPTDFSQASGRAYKVMEQLIAQKTKSVTLVHVDSTELPDYVDKDALLSGSKRMNQLKELACNLTYPDHLKVYIEMPKGSPVKEMNRIIRMSNYTLLIMAIRGKGNQKGEFAESLSFKMARKCKLPVLFVPGE